MMGEPSGLTGEHTQSIVTSHAGFVIRKDKETPEPQRSSQQRRSRQRPSACPCSENLSGLGQCGHLCTRGADLLNRPDWRLRGTQAGNTAEPKAAEPKAVARAGVAWKRLGLFCRR
ncbi:unnamed protein product [Merluccius merluccius]